MEQVQIRHRWEEKEQEEPEEILYAKMIAYRFLVMIK